MHFDSRIEAQPIHVEVRRVGVARDLQGIVPWPQEAGMLSRNGSDCRHHIRRQVDAAGDAVVARMQIAQGGRVAWPVVARRQPLAAPVGVASQDVVGGHQMVSLAVGKAAHQGVLVGAGGKARQVLADRQSRQTRGNRPEFSTDFRRRIRLHVEHIDMAGAAREEDEDHRFPLS